MAFEKNKRKKFINDKQFQVGLAYKLGMLNLFGVVLLTLLFFILAQDIVSTLIIKYQIQLPDSSHVLIFKNLPVMIGYFLLIALYVVFYAFLTIRMTHRMTGPIFAVKRKIGEIRRGDLRGELKLRPNDYGKDLATEVNELQQDLSSRITDIYQEMEGLSELTKDAKISLRNDASDEIKDLHARIIQIIHELKFFQVEAGK